MGGWLGGSDGDLTFGFDFVDGDAEHLAADEVGDVYELGSRGRHSDGDGDVVVLVLILGIGIVYEVDVVIIDEA